MRKAINLLEEVIANKVELRPEIVRSFVAPGVAYKALESAMNGDLEGAIRVLEDMIIDNRLDVDTTINQFYKAIKNIPSIDARAKAWIALAEAERAIRLGGSPLVQLAGFVSTVWFYSLARRREK